MNVYSKWFRRVVLAGVAVNLSLAVPGLFGPNLVLAAIQQRPCGDLVWGRFAAFLIVLVTLMDIPAALDPRRYRAIAWLAVFNRAAGVVFFFGFQREYLLFGCLDTAFAVPSCSLLYLFEAQGRGEVGRAVCVSSPSNETMSQKATGLRP